jgi:uncharacterized cupredoxin-like copper-binding protein
VALAAVGLTACGGSSGSSSSSSGPTKGSSAAAPAKKSTGAYGSASSAPAKPSTTASASASSGTLALTASESSGLSFAPKTLSAKAGKVTLKMANPGGNSAQHGIAIEGNGVDRDGQVVAPGGASTVTASLKPGTYTFYCPVPGHRAAGMQGTLTVR